MKPSMQWYAQGTIKQVTVTVLHSCNTRRDGEFEEITALRTPVAPAPPAPLDPLPRGSFGVWAQAAPKGEGIESSRSPLPSERLGPRHQKTPWAGDLVALVVLVLLGFGGL